MLQDWRRHLSLRTFGPGLAPSLASQGASLVPQQWVKPGYSVAPTHYCSLNPKSPAVSFLPLAPCPNRPFLESIVNPVPSDLPRPHPSWASSHAKQRGGGPSGGTKGVTAGPLC